MSDTKSTIQWEEHEDGEEGAFQSKCGRFEISMDPVFGYYSLHEAGDTTTSIAEAFVLSGLTEVAERHLLRQAA
mgnify:CR=1 FL=1